MSKRKKIHTVEDAIKRIERLEAENKELRSLWIENEGDIIEQKTRLDKRQQIVCDGIIVSPRPYGRNDLIYAEVVPSGYMHWWRRLLPWVGNWWFEVHTTDVTLAYEKGGSGGGYTLSGCMRKAMQAVDDFERRHWELQRKTADTVSNAVEKLKEKHNIE